MGDMTAAVLCLISFVVLGLGNCVVSDGVSPSAANDAVDAKQITDNVTPAISSTTEHSLAKTVSDAQETMLPATEVALPGLDDSPLPSSSPNPSVAEPTVTENAKTTAMQSTSQVRDENSSKNESFIETQSDEPFQAKLSHDADATTTIPRVQENSHVSGIVNASESTDVNEKSKISTTPTTDVHDELKPDIEPSNDGEHVTFVNHSTADTEKSPLSVSPPLIELSPNGSFKDGKAPENSASKLEEPDSQGRSSVEFEGATIDSQKENEKSTLPTVDDGKSVLTTTSTYDDYDLPETQTSSSVEIQGTATVLHIWSKENEKLPPPTSASLTEDGETGKSETDNEPAPATPTPPVQDVQSDEVLLTPAPNKTANITIKPSTKPTVEKCPENSTLPCVSKCCPYGYGLVNDRCRINKVRFIPQFTLLVNGFNDSKPENETEKMAKYNLIAQNLCVKNRYRLDPSNESVDEFHLLYNGSLWLPATKPHHTMIASDQYCMEVFKFGDQEVMLPLLCFNNQPIVESSFHFMVYPIGLLISVPFLLATFIVYNMIPELRNLHGKSLSCYVLCLMMAYIFLAVVQLGGQGFDNHVCVGVAFAIQFSFIACFFWLNVLCFDTWRNVFIHGDLGYTMEKSQERSFFIFYSIYAWSFTIALIIVTMVMNFTPTIPSSYLKPGIGENTCWFNTEREAFPYFYGPVGVLIIINVILFIMTAIKLILEHHKQAICVRTPGQTFRLCLTLFFIMGINWVMEIISWAAGGPPFIWYITDICNTLQGIFIFVVFVMDERVRGLCKTELFPRLQEFFAACCPQRRTRRASTEPHYDSINGQEMVYMFKKDDIEQ